MTGIIVEVKKNQTCSVIYHQEGRWRPVEGLPIHTVNSDYLYSLHKDGLVVNAIFVLKSSPYLKNKLIHKRLKELGILK
jgi:hypothetical protein